MNNMQNDYIERLEFMKKLFGISGVVFWLLSLVSVEPGALMFIGMVMPMLVVAAASNKPAVLYVYAICTVVYVVIAIILTHRFFNFTPHLACCVCVIGDLLMAGTVEKAEKCYFDLETQKKRYKELEERYYSLKEDIRLGIV